MRAQAACAKALDQFNAGDPEAAKRTLRAHLQREPAEPNVNQLLAMILAALNEWPQALFHVARAADASPADPELRFMHANTLYQMGRSDDALQSARRALSIDPAHAGAVQIAAKVLFSRGDFDQAAGLIRATISRSPSPAQLYQEGAIMLQELGRTADSTGLLREAVERFPSDLRLVVQVCYSLNFVDADPAEHLALHRQAGELAAPSARQTTLPPPPPGPLRVGILSSDLCDHACGTFMLPLLRRLSAHDIELFLYSTTPAPDAVSERFASCGRWRDLRDGAAEHLAAACARDAVHILIETNGWTAGTRLHEFSRRFAPVQATWLGYPNTTGVPGVDLRLVDAVTDPPGAGAFASERLIRVPGCFLCYEGQETDPVPAPSGHAANPGTPFTFGSFNRISKLSDRAAGIWARVLHAVPNSRLLLKARVQSAELRAAYAEKFAPYGIDASRIDFSPYAPDHQTHLSLYNQMDVALDCFPYNGTTTTCEALWMGVPVVTLAGRTHRARVGASLLAAAGFPEFIARDEDDFVRVASTLAADRPALALLKSSMRAKLRSSELCGGDAYARRFAAALRSPWPASVTSG